MGRQSTIGAELGLGLSSGDGALTGTVTRDTTIFRSGAASYKCSSGAGAAASVSRDASFVLAQATYTRAYMRFEALPATTAVILRFGGAAYPTLRIKSNGKFGLYDPSATQIGSDSATTVTAGDGIWYQLALMLTIGTGATDAAEAQVGGSSIASTSSQTWSDTLPTALNFGWVVSPGATNKLVYVDDIAINDISGSSETSWPGVGSVVALFPVSTSSAGGWTVGAGGTFVGALSNIPPIGTIDGSTNTTQIRSVSTTANDTASMVTATYDSIVPSGATITLVQSYVDHAEGAGAGTKNMDSAVTANPSGSFHTAVAFGGDSGAAGGWPSSWRGTFGTPVYAPTVTLSTGATVAIRDVTTSASAVECDQMALIVEYVPGAGGTYTKAGAIAGALTIFGPRDRNVAPKTGSTVSPGVLSGSRARDVNPKTGNTISAGILSGFFIKEKTKTGSFLSDGILSGARARDVVRTTTLISDGALSGSRARNISKTAALIIDAVLSGSRARDVSKTAALINDGVLSGSRARNVGAKTGSLFADLILSGSRARDVSKTGIVISSGALSGIFLREKTKTGIFQSDLILSGSKFRISDKTGSLSSDLILSGAWLREILKSGAILSSLVISGASVYIPGIAIYTKTGSFVGTLVLSGPKTREAIRQGSLISSLALSGDAIFIATEAGIVSGGHRILSKQIWSGDAELPHADDIIFTHGRIRIRIGTGLYV